MFFMRKWVNVAAIRFRFGELNSILGCEASSIVNMKALLLLLLLLAVNVGDSEDGAGRK